MVGLAHAYMAKRIDEALGNFNDHLKETVLLVMDECENFGGDIKSNNLLKSMITSTSLNVNTKMVKQYTVDKFWHPVMLGNRANGGWIVRVEQGDRRSVVCESDLCEDFEYNASVFGGADPLFTEANAEIFFQYLGQRDLSRVDLRRVPESDGRHDLQMMNPEFQPVRFLLEKFGDAAAALDAPASVLFEMYTVWARNCNIRCTTTKQGFVKQLARVGIRSERRPGGTVYRLTPEAAKSARDRYLGVVRE